MNSRRLMSAPEVATFAVAVLILERS
jgi:hypothetical protein